LRWNWYPKTSPTLTSERVKTKTKNKNKKQKQKSKKKTKIKTFFEMINNK
jgi:hypothetical protein